jgi:hypothetical protein
MEVNAQTKIEAVTMRTPFAANHISKLPKETRAQIDARKSDKSVMVWKCDICGGAHHKNAVHLDYVGHAALTDRLLDVDPEWHWEPVALDADGLPAFDRNGGLWIKLTVNGVTRLGYGDADGKIGGNAVKEAIGDAMRNAAMRFGAALDLWHKGDLHLGTDEGEAGGQSQQGAVSPPQPWTTPIKNKSNLHKALCALERELAGCGDSDMVYGVTGTREWKDFVTTAEVHAPHYLRGGDPAPPEFIGLLDQAERLVRQFDTAQANNIADVARA